MKNRISLIITISILMVFNVHLSAQIAVNTDNSQPDPSAMLDVKSTTKGVLVPRMTQTERNNISSPSTGLMIYQTDQTPGFYHYNGSVWTSVASSGQHYVGELFGGGIVCWVDNTGQHGLIVSLVDININSTWSNITAVLIGTTAQSTWNGQSNSTAIMGQSGHTNSAAKLCDEYVNADYGTGIYSDWYLPAIDQLSLIYHSRYILNKNIEGISGSNILVDANDAEYWSSTEKSNTTVWYFYFAYGDASYGNGAKNANNRVRAIRTF